MERLSADQTHSSAEDTLTRKKALTTWLAIIEKMGTAFELPPRAEGIDECDWLEDYLTKKATGTLLTRASAWTLYLRYTLDKGLNPAELDEQAAFAYLAHLRSIGAPPSRADSFIRAALFAFGCLRFNRGHAIGASSRCQGKAAMSMAEKRVQRQRDPLKAAWLRLAEAEVARATTEDECERCLNDVEAIILGFLLFCVHSRSRCSDAARILAEPTLDELDGPNGAEASFVEAQSTGSQMKTGNTAKRARLLVPVVGLSKGLHDVPWARSWLQLRSKLGLDAATDECLQREPLTNETFGAGRIKAGQATDWLRAVLLKLGIDSTELGNVGSHSCKATLLSMAAKAGIDGDTRRTLGGHAHPSDKSVDIYSRDSLSAPLRSLAALLTQIRVGAFDPDASRSGRWTVCLADDAGANCHACSKSMLGEAGFLCPCGRWAHSLPSCSVSCLKCNSDFCGMCSNYAEHRCSEMDYDSRRVSYPFAPRACGPGALDVCRSVHCGI